MRRVGAPCPAPLVGKIARSAKASKWRFLLVAAIALFGLFQVSTGVVKLAWILPDNSFACDLRFRRNEVRCAHQGVNSFHIWNREITLPGFVPMARRDKAKVERTNESDAPVHAYPPWHTALFWFYGWLPEIMCISLMSVVFGICLAFVVTECFRLSKARFRHPGLVVGFALAFISNPVAQCSIVLNYGVLILAAFLLMNRALEKNNAILAGLAWAVMMVKPQVGLLFVWPLFWHRRYLTIATAAVVCFAGAVFTSFAVHESVIDLILQIPELGRPYWSGIVMDKFMRPFFGDGATFLVPAFFFAVVGILTRMSRENRDFLVCCVPAALIIPIWTYSQGHDHVILLPTVILLAGRILVSWHWNALSVLCCLYIILLMFCHLWSLLAVGLKVFDPTGLGWIYRIAEYSSYALMLAIAALFVRDSRRAAPPASVHLL